MPKQKDGRYRAKITVGHVDGKPIVKYASGRTKKELEANKEELRRSFVTGAVQAQRDVLFDVYAMEWYSAYKKKTLSVSSRACYASVFNVHIIPAFSGRQLRAVTAAELQHFMNSKAGMSVSSLGYMKSILTGIYRTAYAHGIVDRDPTVGLTKPKARKESKRALTKAEAAASLKVGWEHPEGLLLLILYYTGLRIGEALGLQWGDYDTKARTLSVRRDVDFRSNSVGELKTEHSRRVVPVPDELARALDPLRGLKNVFILQSPETHSFIPQSTYKRRWARLMRAMLEADPTIENEDGVSILTPHYYRHNYASVLYNAGVDILSAQKYLGHADAKTTLQIYSHLAEEKADENAGKVKEAFASK